ncbi:MAG: tRNA pseudouridine synthase A [Gracilimonas sp.]|nr:tRNA pseudouridine synthase A [Gracilimonas sp.]
MQKYKLTIEFDGTDFSGWQIQPTDRTVEGVLEQVFSKVLQQDIDLIGQGRTDAGVHGRGQVAHVDLPEDADIERILQGVNGLAGDEIQVIEYEEVSESFHARFDAISREYEYTITTRPVPLMRHHSWALRQAVDLKMLEDCAALLNGEFDFAGFSKFNEDNFTTLCEIQSSVFETRR